MNKQELIAEAAKKCGLSRTDMTKALEATLATIVEALKGDGKGNGEVRILGFGTFLTSKRASKVARNPKTNEPIHVAASTQPKFKAGKILKKALN